MSAVETTIKEGGQCSTLVVVTGFGPFEGFSNNPSEKVVRLLAERGLDAADACTLITEIIPVAYHDVNQAVFKLWKFYNPDLVIHVGAHPDERKIFLEQRSFGSGYVNYDIKDQIPAGQVCPRSVKCESNDDVIDSGLDCNEILKNASAKLSCDFLTWKVSYDPGRYLCAYSYFISLSHDRCRSLFVHIPDFDNKVTEDILLDALRLVIKECLSQIPKKQE